MDMEGNDDMLFSIPNSQDCPSDVWSDESDSEMLVVSSEHEDVPWDLQSSPMLMAAADSEESDEQFDMQIEPDFLSATEVPRTSSAASFARDRYALMLAAFCAS
jgi:hypothetical protein